VGVRFSAPVQTGPGPNPAALYNGYRLSQGQSGQGVAFIIHPPT